MTDRLLIDCVEEKQIKKQSDGLYYFYIQDKNNNLYYMLEIQKYFNSNSILINFFLLSNGKMSRNITNTGHAKTVYATVLTLTKRYIDDKKPDEFCFNGDEEHKKFYKFYSKAILPLFPDYNLSCFDDLNLYIYTRKDIKLGEIQKNLNSTIEILKNIY